MASMSEHHRQLINGVGKCSVPMWIGGCPAGFCDKPAYGERPPAEVITRWDGYQYRLDGRYAGYVPGLACSGHGGPAEPRCAPGCQGVELEPGVYSGCACPEGKLASGAPIPPDFKCDCLRHPEAADTAAPAGDGREGTR